VLFNKDKGISIDLHWAVFRELLAPTETIENLFTRNLSSLEYEGRAYSIFDPEFELLYLIYHGTWHNWNRLKWLMDVFQLLKIRIIDEEKFIHLINENGSYRLVGLCNILLTDFFPDGPRVPGSGKAPDFLINFSRRCIKEENEQNLIGFWNKLQTFRFLMKLAPGLLYKFNVFKILLFPFDQINNPLIPPYAFFFYLAGPFIKVWKRIKK